MTDSPPILAPEMDRIRELLPDIRWAPHPRPGNTEWGWHAIFRAIERMFHEHPDLRRQSYPALCDKMDGPRDVASTLLLLLSLPPDQAPADLGSALAEIAGLASRPRDRRYSRHALTVKVCIDAAIMREAEANPGPPLYITALPSYSAIRNLRLIALQGVLKKDERDRCDWSALIEPGRRLALDHLGIRQQVWDRAVRLLGEPAAAAIAFIHTARRAVSRKFLMDSDQVFERHVQGAVLIYGHLHIDTHKAALSVYHALNRSGPPDDPSMLMPDTPQNPAVFPF